MKKTKMPGDNISLKTKKSEDPAIMQWINSQTNLMDSLRYLIENEIGQNGVRNLQAFIPTERSTWNASGAAAGLMTSSAAIGAGSKANEEVAAASLDLEGLAASMQPEQEESEPAAEDEFDDEDIESWT
ncbi:hypothetical protein [Paenibacillus nasutitermitis]|uniref:hypothetical protein n=1 Tax=Paenibacillus nasutitermitis TaxID=1652958 RepID=UPI001663771F|nr:hypothetical protein [Paenibacillus nasutitermitis]